VLRVYISTTTTTTERTGVDGEDIGEGGQQGWSGWGPYTVVHGKTAQQAGLVTLSSVCQNVYHYYPAVLFGTTSMPAALDYNMLPAALMKSIVTNVSSRYLASLQFVRPWLSGFSHGRAVSLLT
jgi:hypothetical protein